MLQRAQAAERTADAALTRLGELVDTATALSMALRSCDSWTGPQRARALQRLDRLAGALAAARSGLLVAERRAQTSIAPGDRDFVAARARATRAGLGEARREVRQAQTLEAMPAVADAVREGRVPLPHVDALARVTSDAGERASSALARPEVQERLVVMAQRQSVTEFGAAAARLMASFDPASLERGVAAQRRERFFVMSHQPEGTFLKGRLDHLSAEVVRVAIASVRQAPDDERDKAQADADALVAVAERAVSGMAGVRARRTDDRGLLAPDDEQDSADARVSGVANRPTVSILVPAETFAELREARSRERAGRESSLLPVEPACLEDGTPLSTSQLARVLCDCEVGRIVLSAEGLPLDVGRTERLFTAAQRRAIVVRDRHCAWNGCEVPAAYCEAHHIRWWDRDEGETSVENGVLLCSHHHHVVHQLDLEIARLAAPRRARGAPLGEPTRYEFRCRDGGVVNAPPGPRTAPDPTPGRLNLFEVA
jgi:hypothetical protein